MKGKRLSILDVIILFSMCISFITFPIYLLNDFIINQDIISQLLLIFIFGFSGIGVFKIVGNHYIKLIERERKLK